MWTSSTLSFYRLVHRIRRFFFLFVTVYVSLIGEKVKERDGCTHAGFMNTVRNTQELENEKKKHRAGKAKYNKRKDERGRRGWWWGGARRKGWQDVSQENGD